MEKKCKKCNVVKDVSEFSKEKRNRDGLAGVCKVCRKPYYEKYRENNTDKIKQYREANKGKLSEYNKQYREANKERLKQYGEANTERTKEVQRKYRDNNKEKLKQYRRKKYEANKRKPNLQEIKTEQEKKRLFEEGKKQCNKCNIVNSVGEFSKEKKNRDGLRGECNVCRKKYAEDNREKIADKSKKWREENEEKIKEKRKKYYKANKERLADYNKKYMKGYLNKYKKTRIKTDSLFKLTTNTRRAVTRYLRDGKNKRTKEIIGIGFKEFQTYLGKEYTEGMHLDHIIPLSWANNDEEVYILNHYSNFQIITAEDNIAKSDTYCKSENLNKVLDNHNDLAKLNKIIERNSDKIK
jgi:hypothetical protein